MSINYQHSHELNIQKISNTAKDLSNNVSKISNEDLIEYLEVQNQRQQKRDKLVLIITIIGVIASIGALITGIIGNVIAIIK